MHSIVKTCLPGCPDACRALVPFFPACCHRVNPPLDPPPPSFATRLAVHPLSFTLLPVKPASCLHFKLMDPPRTASQRQSVRRRWVEKRDREGADEKTKGEENARSEGAKAATYPTVSLPMLPFKQFSILRELLHELRRLCTRWTNFSRGTYVFQSTPATQNSSGRTWVMARMSVSRWLDEYKCACAERRGPRCLKFICRRVWQRERDRREKHAPYLVYCYGTRVPFHSSFLTVFCVAPANENFGKLRC